MKIKAKNPKVSSMKLIVPIDGIIDIDVNGVAEVSTKCAVQLVTGTSDWEYLKKGGNELLTKVDSNDDEEDDDEDSDERVEFEEGLKKLTLAQMKDWAKEAEYPEEEYGNITTKKLMHSYLLKKYDGTV